MAEFFSEHSTLQKHGNLHWLKHNQKIISEERLSNEALFFAVYQSLNLSKMKIFAETERLILREILLTDESAMFEMDSDPEVHTFLGNNPVKSREEMKKIIQSIRQQYSDYGIGRWAAIEKATGNFIGWSGLKFITESENNKVNFYDVGYRLAKKYWGKGYATESAKAALRYAFEEMNLEEVIGTAHVENKSSRNVLEKCGLTFVEKFYYKDIPCDWLKISNEEWQMKNK
jgi:ribosomal-protein-alanine N-acetyltransferase